MNIKIAASFCILMLPAAAHAERWEKAITLYGWVPGLDATIATNYGDLKASPSGGDILSGLNMAFMGVFEAGKGRWRFIKDILYVDLSEDKNTPFGVLFANGEIDTRMTAATGYVSYSVFESNAAKFEVAGGVRYFNLISNVTLEAGKLSTRTDRLSDDWFVPVIGLRGNWKFSDRWSATGFVDYGQSFNGSSETWQVLATMNYSFSDNWVARFGYRFMDVDKTVKWKDVDVGLSGPVIGISYQF